jgi:DNA (cytosine-5)-methyltransferase 1
MDYYNEHDPFAAAWLRELIAAGKIPAGHVDERDIQYVQPSDLVGYRHCHFFAGIGGWALAMRLAEWPDDEPLWTGSCPCPPWSSAARGRGRGFDDPRHLWPAWSRLIAARRPCRIAGEQVASARDWLDQVWDDMEAMHYTFRPVVLPACAIGADHIRERIYFCSDTDRDREPSVSVDAEVAGMSWRDRQPTRVVSSNGVSRLMAGFGNAIVPQVAAEFLRAVMLEVAA